MVASTIFVAIGVGALWLRLPIVSAALVFYGAGVGIELIARGTLPLALFGTARYAGIMGRTALPSLIAQAVAPSLGALLVVKFGPDETLAAPVVFAAVDVAVIIALFGLLHRNNAAQPWSDAVRFPIRYRPFEELDLYANEIIPSRGQTQSVSSKCAEPRHPAITPELFCGGS
jgi:hypothetical protein